MEKSSSDIERQPSEPLVQAVADALDDCKAVTDSPPERDHTTAEVKEVKEVDESETSSPPNDDSVVAALGTANKPETPPEQPVTLGAKIRSIRTLIALVAFSLTYCLLYCAFIYEVLILRHVTTPGVFWEASMTNYVVGVLSQLSALLTDTTIRALLSALRPALASRPGGSSFSTWVSLGPSDWTSILQVAAVNGFLNIWSDVRYAC
jgi:hypothetical protein